MTWGYQTSPLEVTNVRCEGAGCRYSAEREVTYLLNGKPRYRHVLCRGHAPERDVEMATGVAP